MWCKEKRHAFAPHTKAVPSDAAADQPLCRVQAEGLLLSAHTCIVFDLLLAGAPPRCGPAQPSGILHIAISLGLEWPAVAALLVAATPDEVGQVLRCPSRNLQARA